MESQYLNFPLFGPSPSGKTSVWGVQAKSGTELGEIRWHGPWRKYVFRTVNSHSLFDGNCLRDVIALCETQTALHKEK